MPPWKDWREQSQAEQASGRRSRSAIWEGCSVLLLAPMFIIGGIVGVVAATLGINLLAGWMVSLTEPLMEPLYAVIGAALILLAAWAVFRLATGHAPPGTSRRALFGAVVVMIGFGAMGLVFLLAAFAPPAPDTPGF